MTLKEMGHDLFLECGPRSTMCALVRQNFSASSSCTAIPTFAETHEDNREGISVLSALGSLWLNGLSIDWEAFYANEDRRRIPLPNYPFERQRHWVDPAPLNAPAVTARPAASAESLTGPVQKDDSAVASIGLSFANTETRRDRIIAKLLDILVPVSGRDRSQITTSATFLEQGFDSLSLAQVSLAIEHEFGQRVGFNRLMNQMPTVDTVATHLEAALPSADFAPPVRVQPAPDETCSETKPAQPKGDLASQPTLTRHAEAVAEHSRVLAQISNTLDTLNDRPKRSEDPLATAQTNPPEIESAQTTVPQRGIFFSSRLSEHLSSSYNESVTLQIKGTVSVLALTRSLERLVERHDALRAGFNETGSVMKIRPSMKPDVSVKDLSAVAAAPELEETLNRLATEEAARPFVLPDGPLFRSMIVLLGMESAAVILTAHHVICDGWSVDVLVQELCTFYSEELSGTPSLPRPQLSFANYAAQVALREQGAQFAAAKEYWRNKFAGGFPALTLPTDYPTKAAREHRAKRIDRVIGTALVDQLRELAAKQGCSQFAVTVTALSLLLARISGQRRFVLALSMAEQPLLGLTDLVGHCVSLMPFLVELRAGEDLRACLVRVQRELAEDQDHLSFTLVHLLEDLVSTSQTRTSPVPVGLTSIRKFRPDELEQHGFELDYVANPKSFESFEWYLAAMESNLGVELHSHFDTQLFRDATILAWLADFESILIEMVSNPGKTVFELTKLRPVLEERTEPMQFVYSPGDDGPEALLQQNEAVPVDVAALPHSGDAAKEREKVILTRLLGLWRRVLNRRSVCADDSFFDLGGHSLKAAQLFALIERDLHIAAPLAALYEAPTPRQLAALLAGGISQASWRALVPIHVAGDRPPLFLIHGAEGNVLLYRALASHLGEDQPVYGMQSAGLDGRSQIDGNFERVARRYLNEVRQIQAEGPYLLGGYCLGGILAMEMARQLLEAGERVGLLAMIEVFNVRSVRWPLPWHIRAINRLFVNPWFHFRNMRAAEGGGKLQFLTEKLDVELGRARAEAGVILTRIRQRLHLAREVEFHHLRIADVYETALAAHDIKPYPGAITLFMPKQCLMGMTDPLGGWGGVVQGGIRLHTLPFRPKGSLTEPYVGQVARLLRDCIDEVVQNEAIAADTDPLVASEVK